MTPKNELRPNTRSRTTLDNSRFSVGIGEIRNALDTEIEMLEQRLEWLMKDMSLPVYDKLLSVRGGERWSGGYMPNLESAQEKIRARLRSAERRLLSAREAEACVAERIDAHNRFVNNLGLMRTVIYFRTSWLKARKLQREFETASRERRRAERQRQLVSRKLMDSQNSVEKGGGIPGDPNGDHYHYYRSKGKLIRFHHLCRELNQRRELRQLLDDLGEEDRVVVRHRDLGAAINDPMFRYRLMALRRRGA